MDRRLLTLTAIFLIVLLLLVFSNRQKKPEECFSNYNVTILRSGFSPGRINSSCLTNITFRPSDVPHNIKCGGIEKYLQVGESFTMLFNKTTECISDSYDGSGKTHHFTFYKS